MTHDELGPGKEFDTIRNLLARWGASARGIGDDAAVLEVPAGERIVISTDACVENRHFKKAWIDPREIGYRAAMAALSDLAAMAARPLGVLIAFNLPASWRSAVGEVADGIAEAAGVVGAPIIGGNITAAEELSITTTVVGAVAHPMTRRGARPGDRLYVTGRLGGPGLAIAAWSGGRTPAAADRERFARPAARIEEARWLVAHGATAGLDISDGLVGDARHLAAASGAGGIIHLDRLPLVADATPMDGAMSGEEYELLVSATAMDAAEFSRRFAIPLTEIGEVTSDTEVVVVDRGRRVAAVDGHDHFST